MFEPEWQSRVIMDDDTIIGFVFYGMWEEKNAPLFCRYMIDIEYQGKGYGKRALPIIVDEMMREYQTDCIYLTLEAKNERAVHLYTQFGFVATGEMDGNETIYIYKKQ